MTPLYAWATRHAVSPAALADLLAVLGVGEPQTAAGGGQAGSEASVQAAVRMEHARRTGGRLFRNNSGVAEGPNGQPVRYGLCNDSTKLNAVCKSSDLIGITPITCQCGQRYGLFTALECKRPGWKFRLTDERAVAQAAFIKLVVSLGGIGRFITSVEEL